MSAWEDCKVKGMPWSSALFLYIFIALFTVFCAVSAESVTSDSPTTQVSELPFLQKLSNPCALVNGSSLHSGSLTEESRRNILGTLFDVMKAQASVLKDNAQNLLTVNSVDCSTLHLPLVAVIPSANDTLGKAPLDVLHMYYSSLLTHTAQVYFSSEQSQQYLQDQCESTEFSNSITGLAANMRELICALRLGTLVLQDSGDASFESSTTLNERLTRLLTDQPLCSRRLIYDCQVVRSTVLLLQELHNFLHSTVLIDESTTVFGFR